MYVLCACDWVQSRIRRLAVRFPAEFRSLLRRVQSRRTAAATGRSGTWPVWWRRRPGAAAWRARGRSRPTTDAGSGWRCSTSTWPARGRPASCVLGARCTRSCASSCRRTPAAASASWRCVAEAPRESASSTRRPPTKSRSASPPTTTLPATGRISSSSTKVSTRHS